MSLFVLSAVSPSHWRYCLEPLACYYHPHCSQQIFVGIIHYNEQIEPKCHAPISLGCPKCLSEQGGPWGWLLKLCKSLSREKWVTPVQLRCIGALRWKSMVKCFTFLERSWEDASNRPKNAWFGLESQKLWAFKVGGVLVAPGHLRVRREGFMRNPSMKYVM